ncbi:hypothetical protein Tco_1320109, partial [Tanacetum coccineum]
MNQEQIRQVTTRDEKWVLAKERVKISTANVRLETTVPHKEETFQVIIDVIKNSTYYKAFTISTECLVFEVFRKILDICLRVQGVDFAEVLDDETTLAFLIDHCYKGPLHKHPNILKFVRISEDFQEYGLPIPKTMLTEGIKQSESYQMFFKYSSGQIPPKKRRDDNIIPEPDVALELGKSISLTEAAKEEAARQVHVTHARIVTVLEPARRRPS